jgi:hypothetical protein
LACISLLRLWCLHHWQVDRLCYREVGLITSNIVLRIPLYLLLIFHSARRAPSFICASAPRGIFDYFWVCAVGMRQTYGHHKVDL